MATTVEAQNVYKEFSKNPNEPENMAALAHCSLLLGKLTENDKITPADWALGLGLLERVLKKDLGFLPELMVSIGKENLAS